MKDQLLTSAEIADLEGSSPDVVRARARRGEGPPVIRIGIRSIRFRLSDWQSWVASREES